MRGSPLLRFAGLAVLLLAAGLPVWCLTGTRDEAAPEPVAQPHPAQNGPVQLAVSSTEPAAISVSYGGKTIWNEPEPTADAEKTVDLPIGSPADLVIKAAWKNAAARHAIRVIATRHEEVILDTTLWGEAEIEDVVTVPAQPAP